MTLAQLKSDLPGSTVQPFRPVDLLTLARSRDVGDRQRLLLGVTALCEAAPPSPGDASHAVLGEIFMLLAGQAEREVRKALADSLAASEWAPPALISMLALDEIEIARPVIAASPLLNDADLLRVLVEATVEHQIEVARRPRISARVADAVIDAGEPVVMTALAGNRTAEIAESGIQRLVEASRRVAALRAPLIRHPRLNSHLAEQLYAWVGQSLRQAIHERFRIDTAELDAAIEQAVLRAVAPPVAASPMVVDPQRDEMDRRLIGKLQASGQLRPGYLIRAIREGRLSLFENALATLGGFPIHDVRQATQAETPDLLALACASVGIDRAVFPALLDEIRGLNQGLPAGFPTAGLWSAHRSPEGAAREFRRRARPE